MFGDTTSTLTLNDLKGADFDDPRWDELVGKVTIDEFLNFASNAFHNIQNIDSVGLLQYAADDGPNGSDSHYLTEAATRAPRMQMLPITTTAPASAPPRRTLLTAGTRNWPTAWVRSPWARAPWC